MNSERGYHARHKGLRPRVPTTEDRVAFAAGEFGGYLFPNIGDYIPKDWDLIETYFVDNSGFGLSSEPALTQMVFAHKLANRPAEHGYAVVETGQFQVYVGEFAPRPKRVRKAKQA